MTIHERLSGPGRFGPLTADDPLVGNLCIECDEPLQTGQRPTLVNGTPASDDDADRAAAGRAHNVTAQVAHEDCAYPD